MKLLAPLTLMALVLTATGLKAADEGPWMVRVRAVNIQPANNSDAYSPLGIPSNGIHVSSKTIPEVDFSYFFTKNFSAELILTYPQSHDVTATSTALGVVNYNIGSFKELPPTLTAQWHFLPGQMVNPYVGVGLNLTLLSSVKLNVPTVGALTLASSSVGPAAQAGVDIKVADHWYINVDVKYVGLSSDVKFNGTKISTVNVNPMLYGVGVGYTF